MKKKQALQNYRLVAPQTTYKAEQRIGGTKESFSAQGAVSQVRRIGICQLDVPGSSVPAPTTAILDQPDVVRQESWHTSAFRLESRLSTSSSVQNIIGSSMGPSGEG
jgi:hypothetical protein